MSICAWRSFGTSPSAGCCQGRDQNKRGAGVPAPSCLFTPQLAASTRQERLGHRRRAKTCLSVRVKEHGVKKLKKSPEPAENCYRGVLEPTHTHTHTRGNRRGYTQLYVLDVRELRRTLHALFCNASEMRSPNYYFHCAPLL